MIKNENAKLPNQKTARWRTLLKHAGMYLTAMVLCLVVFFVIGEVAVRIYWHKTREESYPYLWHVKPEPVLGYYGKKVFGNPKTTRMKIMVLGDSFTDGCGIKEQDMYYQVISQIFNAELFVYGGGGYGTLQEYLALDMYMDEIHPNLIILQVCNNDFINNSFELEASDYRNSLLATRPYLINGKVEYRLTRYNNFLQHIRWWFRDSLLVTLIFNSFDKITYDLAGRGVIKDSTALIEKKGLNYPPFRRSRDTTAEIIGMLKKRANGIPIVAFPTETQSMQTKVFAEIFAAKNIPYFIRPAQVVEELGKKISITQPVYGHWNAIGHRIVGQTLAEDLIRLIAVQKMKRLQTAPH